MIWGRILSPRILWVGAVAALASMGPVALPAQAEVFLENMTSPELATAIADGQTTVLIPTGGTEQNAGHMVLGKHNIRVRAISAQIAETLGDAIVAPVIALVPEGGVEPPSGHMLYPGSLTIPPELFAANVEWTARSLRLAGFRHIVLLGDSGWNQQPLAQVAERLNAEWGGGVLFANAYYDSFGPFTQWLEAQGFTDVGGHAALADTALMMAVDPSALRDIDTASRKGAGGDPTGATAELGRVGVDMYVTRTVAQIRAFRGE